MPTMLVTGGGGFLGRTVLAELLRTFPGRIVSIHRTPLRGTGAGLPPPHLEVRADLRDAGRWHHHLADADYVLWLAAARDHGASPRQMRQHNDPRGGRPRVLADTSPPHPVTPYGHSKLAGERLLASSGVAHTVLRLPFLYGPGFAAGSFLSFYGLASRTPMLSAIRYTGNLSLLHTADVAAIVRAVIADDGAADASPYLVSDGVTYEVDDLITRVAAAHGLHRPAIRLPGRAGRAVSAAALAANRLTAARAVPRGRLALLASYWSHAAFTRDYFVADSSRFRAAFGGVRFTPVDDGLRSTYGRSPAGRPRTPDHAGRRSAG